MHDPNILAFRIKSPFREKPTEAFPKGYRNDLITVWHRDPESDGTDDSCGWSYPRLTVAQRESLRNLAWCEAYRPWFQRVAAKELYDELRLESLMRGAILNVAHVLDIPITWEQVCYLASSRIHAFEENFRGAFCFLPGWHSNFEEDRRKDREDHAYGLFSGIALHLLRERRPWWRHPRWHVWHWRIQVHPYAAFLRWAFTRCRRCGGRFRWGETGIGTWDGDGPRWFRSEALTHMRCEPGAEPHP